MTHRLIRAVVFDLDGTLADTANDVQRALNRALAASDLPSLDADSVRLMIGGGPRLLVITALERLGVACNPSLLDKLVRDFHAAYLQLGDCQSVLYVGAEQCLRRLKAAGMRIGLCSNKPDDLCRKFIGEIGVSSCFDAVQGSGTGLPLKPDAAPLLAVIDRLGSTPAATLYVGDSETDVLTARAAGVEVGLVSHGYSKRPATELGADRVYDSLAEIREVRMQAISA